MDWLPAALFWGVPLAYILFRGFRSPDQRFLERWARVYGIELTEANRPMIVAYLRRTTRIRTVGALVGLATSILFVTLTNGGQSNSFLGNGLFLALVGYLVGTVVAEAVVPRPPRGAVRTASLVPRTLQDYLPGHAVAALRGLPALSVALIPVYVVAKAWSDAPVSNISEFGFAVTSAILLVMAIGIEVMQRMIVHRPQPVLALDLVEADDAIRSASVHALAGGGVALSLIWLTYQLGAIGNGQAAVLSWVLAFLAILSIGLALASWIDLAHPKEWRVRRHVQQGSRA
ncbi:MAG TPA: hypothetical protein VGL18_14885 [Actinomycetota bacterium]